HPRADGQPLARFLADLRRFTGSRESRDHRSLRQSRAVLQAEQRRRPQTPGGEAPGRHEAAAQMRRSRRRVPPGALLSESLRRPAHSARGRRASERHDPLRQGPQDFGARPQLQSSRRGQPLCRRRQLLCVFRGGEPGAHHHGECPARGRSLARKAERMRTLALLLSICFWAHAADRVTSRPLVHAVDSIGITVSDLDRSVEFFSKVLSFEKVSEAELTGVDYERLQGVFGLRTRVARMKLDEESIELTEYLAPRGRPIPDSRSNDRWFQHIAIITSDMDRAYALLRQNKIQHASSGPQTLPEWNKNAAGIKAFYFKDPDGHSLEILQFPAGKGDAKWHRTDKLFLGVDHTAIVVSDTEASLKFYRDALGLRIVGESENYGTEQEHLNNVFGARLRITSLRAASGGPGIEFLEYLAPRDGRPAPADARASDLFHWQTTLIVNTADSFAKRLLTENSRLVSPGVVTLTEKSLGFSKGLLSRDPDGHVMALVEK